MFRLTQHTIIILLLFLYASSPTHALKLKSFFSPLDVESLEHVKIKRRVGLSVDESLSSSLKGVVDWKSASRDEAEVEDEEFGAFLPPGKRWEDLRVGDSWGIFEPDEDEYVSSSVC